MNHSSWWERKIPILSLSTYNRWLKNISTCKCQIISPASTFLPFWSNNLHKNNIFLDRAVKQDVLFRKCVWNYIVNSPVCPCPCWKQTPYIKHREIDAESGKFKANLDYNYTFPIDLAPKRIPVSVKSIGKVYSQYKLRKYFSVL